MVQSAMGDDTAGTTARQQSERMPTSSEKLIFRDINVFIKKKQILHNVCGMVERGSMLAVMGPSGAGKSTLLSAIAGRMSSMSGEILINDKPLTKATRRQMAYALQSESFFDSLSLRDTLKFMVLLGISEEVSYEDKMAKVDKIVEMMDLKKCVNNLVGTLSGGEKKRINIACEMVSDPNYLLLDEPTSGLDSAISYHLMQSFHNYAQEQNKLIVATVHQPSSEMFHMFRTILLLHDGHVTYYGSPLGLVDFLSGIGLYCDQLHNPADYILHQMRNHVDAEKKIKAEIYRLRCSNDWPSELKGQCQYNYNHDQCDEKGDGEVVLKAIKIKEEYSRVNGFSTDDSMQINLGELTSPSYEKEQGTELQKWPTGFLTQYKVLTHRSALTARKTFLNKLTVGEILFTAIVSGLVWWRLPRSEETINERKAIVFFTTFVWLFLPGLIAVSSYPEERAVINKERAAGVYRLSAYFLAKLTVELPFHILIPTIYWTIVFLMTGLQLDFATYILGDLVIILQSFLGQTIGFGVGVYFLDIAVASTTFSTFITFCFIAGGFLQTRYKSYLVWLRYLAVILYPYHLLLHVEFGLGDPIMCSSVNKSVLDECLLGATHVAGDVILEQTEDAIPAWISVLVMTSLLVLINAICYLLLKTIRAPPKS